jgi:tRNA dimethylallyltransferase
LSATLTFLIGCTGCGKSALGAAVARRIHAEIIGIDSMTVYRGMDIGTAKPSPEIRREIPHHLIDVVDPWEEFSVARYVAAAEKAIADIQGRGRPILVVGGTPLYIKALTEGLFEGPGADPAVREQLSAQARAEGLDSLYRRLQSVDPQTAGRVHPNDERRIVRALEVHALTGRPISELRTQWDRARPRYDGLFLGLRRAPEDQNRRINERVHRMIRDGLVDEVRSLLSGPRPLSTAARQALGYAEILRHLRGEWSLAEAVEAVKINTRRFAKAQRTWFKRFIGTHWIDLTPSSPPESVVEEVLALWSRQSSA